MSFYTSILNLFKINPSTDGNLTYNIDTILNNNWDKIDAAVGSKVSKAGDSVTGDFNVLGHISVKNVMNAAQQIRSWVDSNGYVIQAAEDNVGWKDLSINPYGGNLFVRGYGVYHSGNLDLIGSIIYTTKNTAPTGYLKCNGAAISRSTYSNLYSVIGTTFGTGDGSNTFNLPDLRGEFIRGWDDSRGIDAGRVLGSLQTDDLKSHTHSFKYSQESGGGKNYWTNSAGFPGDWDQVYNDGNLWNNAINLTGGLETRPRNVALLACIKY